jgi:hypothetical protein
MSRIRGTDEILLTLPKVNYAKAGSEVVIRWDETNRVFAVVRSREGKAKASDHRRELLNLLRQVTEEQGINVSPAKNTLASVFNSLKHVPGFPSGMTTHDVFAETVAWQAAGLARVDAYKAANRKPAERLVLTDMGRQACIACLQSDGGSSV